MHRTTIFLSEDLERRLIGVARRRKCSRAELVRKAVQEYLDREIQPMPRSIGMARSSGAGVNSENIKDFVHEGWRKRYG
ncbi:MAG: CopG family transcriptional regulator [Candidatus Dormibacteraceae bacterium]